MVIDSAFGHLRTALVHHWYLIHSGGERVVAALAGMLPRSDLFTLLCDPAQLVEPLRSGRVTTSFIERMPRARQWYRYYAPLYPLAVEQWNLTPYDLVVSSDSSVAKGVITRPETCHVCYCHSPMRYAWNMYHEYLPEQILIRAAFILIMHRLRLYDFAAAQRVDYFVANSETVRRRILKYYRREARVIHPPCEVERFAVSDRIDDYYLFVGRLVDYKRADLAVEAFKRSGRRLLVVGGGPGEKRLWARAGRNIEFLGWQSEENLAGYYARCKALIFPAEEDFGLVPVEAQAAGRPVVALGRGGALETVVAGVTGEFFPDPEVESLNAAVDRLEGRLEQYDPRVIRENATRFGLPRFLAEMKAHLAWCLEDHAAANGLSDSQSKVTIS